jgi:uncharacterized membrane protein YfhO
MNHRYAFCFVFFLLVLAYKGFGELHRTSPRAVVAVGAILVLFVAFAQRLTFPSYVVTKEALQTFGTVFFSVVFAVAYVVLLCLLIRAPQVKRFAVSMILLAAVCLEVFANGILLTAEFDADVGFSTYSRYNNYLDIMRPLTEQVQESDDSFYRLERTYYRKSNDSFALDTNGLSGSTSTLNAETIAFLAQMGYASASHKSYYLGGTPVNDSLLGVKYVLSGKDLSRF